MKEIPTSAQQFMGKIRSPWPSSLILSVFPSACYLPAAPALLCWVLINWRQDAGRITGSEIVCDQTLRCNLTFHWKTSDNCPYSHKPKCHLHSPSITSPQLIECTRKNGLKLISGFGKKDSRSSLSLSYPYLQIIHFDKWLWRRRSYNSKVLMHLKSTPPSIIMLIQWSSRQSTCKICTN